MASRMSEPPNSIFDTDTTNLNPPLSTPAFGIHRNHNLTISQRTLLNDDTITIQAWPSRGGIIVLENATPPDFDFLGLNHLDPPLRRSPNQDEEDAFCQELLRLGATWWDSLARRRFVRNLENGDEEAFEAVDADDSLAPTRLERGWVKVAWPSYSPGSLCVLAAEKIIMGRTGEEKLRPKYHGILGLAKTMDERCELMMKLGGKMYSSIEEVEERTFLRAWERGHDGEVGELFKYEFVDPGRYDGHSGEALEQFEK